mgnify:CR=1 FL=1
MENQASFLFDADGGEVLRWAAVLAPRIDAASLASIEANRARLEFIS